MYDNASGSEPRLIASGKGEAVEVLADPEIWTTISERYADAS